MQLPRLAIARLMCNTDSALRLATSNSSGRSGGAPQQLVLEEIGRNFGLAGVHGFGAVWQWLAPIRQQLAFIDTLRDPKHVYLQCFDCNYVY